MTYILHYDVCAIVLVIITAAFYLAQKRCHDLQSAFFSLALVVTFISAVADIASVHVMFNSPIWAGWLTNAVCLLSMHLLPPLMLTYFLVVLGRLKELDVGQRVLFAVPFVLDALLILTSPLTSLVFYISESAEYLHGTLYYIIYIVPLFYVAASLIIVIKNRARLQRIQYLCVLSFMVLQVAAALLQVALPGYMLVSLAACISLVMMFFTIQSTGDLVDRVSGAYNRNAMFAYCREKYGVGKRFVLLAFAPDNFQQINGIYGTRGGDALIAKIADTLQSTYPNAFVARMMGDRFVALLPDSDSGPDSQRQMLEGFPRVWRVDAFEMHITCCAVAMSSADFSSAEELLTTLEYTVRSAKRMGPGTIVVVDQSTRERLKHTSELEAAVENAIRAKNVEIWYQPIVDIPTGRVVAAEALTRLYDERIGCIMPNEFITIVERSGSIVELGEVIRDKVCAFVSEYDLDSAGIDHISVNLSVIECMNTNLPEQIRKTVGKYGVESRMISFEITESTAAMSKEILRDNMEALIKQGFDFHLDDYGSGYSNIVNLLQLRFSTVKIDKFILRSATGKREGLVERLISPFSYSGIKVVCEGIETPEQAEQARRWNVDFGQGYLYSRPLPAEEFVKFAALKKRGAAKKYIFHADSSKMTKII